MANALAGECETGGSGVAPDGAPLILVADEGDLVSTHRVIHASTIESACCGPRLPRG